jgi:hypothetical protein
MLDGPNFHLDKNATIGLVAGIKPAAALLSQLLLV